MPAIVLLAVFLSPLLAFADDANPEQVNPADPLAAIIGAVGVLFGALKLPEKLGLSPAQVTMILSALLSIAAIVRTLVAQS